MPFRHVPFHKAATALSRLEWATRFAVEKGGVFDVCVVRWTLIDVPM